MTVTTTFSPRPAADFGELSRAGEGRPAMSSVESGEGRFRRDFLGETTCPVPFVRPIRTGPLFAKVSGPHPDPIASLHLTLDYAFGGSSTLDLLKRVPSRLTTTVSGRRRAPRTTPPQVGFRQPTAPSVGQRTPSFYASGNNSENSRNPKLDFRPRRKRLVAPRPSHGRAKAVSPRWGSGRTELVRPEIPGRRCAPTWAINVSPRWG
jgi:hypothetical protein